MIVRNTVRRVLGESCVIHEDEGIRIVTGFRCYRVLRSGESDWLIVEREARYSFANGDGLGRTAADFTADILTRFDRAEDAGDARTIELVENRDAAVRRAVQQADVWRDLVNSRWRASLPAEAAALLQGGGA
jgi:hypothetical protein